jgi:hypothetical protein
MRARFLREVSALGLARPTPDGPKTYGREIEERDLALLPETVRRYLHFMRVVGRPRVSSLRLGWYGSFRMKPGGRWLRCEAWQYGARAEVERYFEMRLRFVKLFPVIARDSYLRGRGRMLGKLFDVVPVVDATGDELDIGELVTYLNDAIGFAPSMILGPETEWTADSDHAFNVAFTDRGRTVHAHVSIDERGAPIEFGTVDRYYQRPDDPEHRFVRTRWTTPFEDWSFYDERPIPMRGQAVWHLPEGPYCYADFRMIPDSLRFDVAPGE